jgi:endonuclease/exonuclease/phosphatase family metal-dependent hydrolase
MNMQIRWRPFATFVALITAACGGGSSPNAPSAAASTRAPITVKVMTFNIQHGIDGNGRYNLQNAASVIARAQPDIVGLQEVTRNHPSYQCDDQPAKIASAVEAATGQRWSVSYQQEWFTPDVSCQQSGRGDGRETEGLVLLTRRSMTPATMTALVDSRIGMQASLVDAYGLPIIVTHLTSGSGSGATRAQQISQLTGWANSFGEPRVLVGDFNAAPGSAELQPMMAAYHDAWTDASTSGRATGNANSHGSSRIDYVFFRPGAGLTLNSVDVIDTTPIVGVQASDHSPVVATFTVR